MFADVGCTVSHSEKDMIDANGRERSVEISFSLDSELPRPTDSGRYSIGVSVALYHLSGKWVCHGDVGWSCIDSGWEEFQSEESEYLSLSELRRGIPSVVSRLLKAYRGLTLQYFETPEAE